MRQTQASRTEITVRRTNGTIETCDSKITPINDALYARMVQATREAGRGDILSYRNIEGTWEHEEKDYQGHCERCGTQVDRRTTYHQDEWANLGGQRIRVTAFYCADCYRLLASIGQGECTAMEERASNVPSYEPTGKED